jgi:hypothetical protein
MVHRDLFATHLPSDIWLLWDACDRPATGFRLCERLGRHRFGAQRLRGWRAELAFPIEAPLKSQTDTNRPVAAINA